LTVKGGRIGTKLGAWVQTIERLGEVKSDPLRTHGEDKKYKDSLKA
jgi:hypothetical protein